MGVHHKVHPKVFFSLDLMCWGVNAMKKDEAKQKIDEGLQTLAKAL